jgi:hypothetical protein
MTTTTEPKPTARGGHLTNPLISDLLENCPCLWQQKVKRVGLISAYATPSGLVMFLDFEAKTGGWTMLTETPTNSVADTVAELGAMISKRTQLRAAPADADAKPSPFGLLISLGNLPDADDYKPAPGFGFAVVEMAAEELRRAPLYRTVELREVAGGTPANAPGKAGE